MLGVIAAISFLSPWMLAGMGLISLPIIAHLIGRRARRRIVFPSVRLLARSRANTSKLFRIRRWIVLALRCLMVCLIAWAFARPVWVKHPAASGDSEGSAAVVLLLDTSASMGQQNEGANLVHSLRALAERALDPLVAGTDRVGVVYASARARMAFPELTNDPEVVREELRGVTMTQERANFPDAIAMAGELLAKHSGQRRLVILSDMQRSNWLDVTLRGAAGSALPAGTVVTILPVGAEMNANVSLSRPRSLPIRLLVDQPARLLVQVTNFTPGERTVRVEATVDNKSIGAKNVTLKPWVNEEVSFDAKLPAEGSYEVVFSVGADQLAADNHAYLTVRAVRLLTAAIVSDDNPNEPGTGSYFLTRALAPRGDMGDVLEVRHLASAALDYAGFADADAVFISDVGKLSRKALEAIHMYVNQGGGAAFFCGEGPVGENLANFQALDADEEIIPWKPQQPRDLHRQGGFVRFGKDGDWDSPVLSEFDEGAREALRGMRFRKVWSAGDVADGAEEILTFNDGSPAMTMQMVGAGKLMLCNFSPALQSSDLGKYGVFVAMTHNLFHYLRPSQRQRAGAVVGLPLNVPIKALNHERAGDWRVIGPDKRPCAAEVTADGARRIVHVPRAALPGFYEVLCDDKPMARSSVNLDPRESDLRRITPAGAREQLAGEDVILTIEDSQQAGALLELRGRPIWHLFILATMAIVAMELILLSIWK